jgi:hypothetical protein
MKAVALIAAALVLAPALSGAQPPPGPLAMAFQSFCLANRGDAAKVLAAADGAGWTAPEAEALPTLGDLDLTDMKARRMAIPGGEGRLLVGLGADPLQAGGDTKLRWRVCIVSGSPPEPEARTALQAFARVAPIADTPGDAGGALFMIADPDGPKPRSVKDVPPAEMTAIAARGGLLALGFRAVGGQTVMLYAAPVR